MKDIKEVKVLKDYTESSSCNEGFAKIKRYIVKNIYTDGTESKEYRLDIVDRKYIDALAVIMFYKENGDIYVVLRETLRPVLMLRKQKSLPLEDDYDRLTLIETVAGVIEKDDVGIEGIKRRARLEIEEESGFVVDEDDIFFLGKGYFASPGLFPEKIYILAARISPEKRKEALGDGSPMEEVGKLHIFSLEQALDLCRKGVIQDGKTEIAIRRLDDYLKGLL